MGKIIDDPTMPDVFPAVPPREERASIADIREETRKVQEDLSRRLASFAGWLQIAGMKIESVDVDIINHLSISEHQSTLDMQVFPVKIGVSLGD